jgi:LPS sulfotransferase NodH
VWPGDAFPGHTFYVIAFAPRTGSNLLADDLTANGLGAPSEYFQPGADGRGFRWSDDLGVVDGDLEAYLAALVEQRSVGETFGTKLAWDHRNALLEAAQRLSGAPSTLDDLFPGVRYIRLVRRDKIGQALSLWRAMSTQRWTSLDGPAPEPAYDYFAVLVALFGVLVDDHLWQRELDATTTPVFDLAYEDFLADRAGTIARLATFLQDDGAPALEPPGIELSDRFERQRDDRSDTARERFLDDLDHRGSAAHWASRAGEVEAWNEFLLGAGWRVGD